VNLVLTCFPKAILFDMDGLMLDSEPIYHAAWHRAALDLGCVIDESRYLALVGRSNDESDRLMLDMFGADFPLARFKLAWNEHWHRHVAEQGMSLKPGIEALLDWIDDVGLAKAVGTSCDRNKAQISLETARLYHRFETIITVDDTGGIGKPAPDIFRLAAQTLGVAPGDCLVLEDSNAGVQAAVAAGMPVIMVPDLQTPSPHSQTQALGIVASLDAIVTLLQTHSTS
jgi:beta-phosphoglucomutase-like phosphatase (HAD superfamily)